MASDGLSWAAGVSMAGSSGMAFLSPFAPGRRWPRPPSLRMDNPGNRVIRFPAFRFSGTRFPNRCSPAPGFPACRRRTSHHSAPVAFRARRPPGHQRKPRPAARGTRREDPVGLRGNPDLRQRGSVEGALWAITLVGDTGPRAREGVRRALRDYRDRTDEFQRASLEAAYFLNPEAYVTR